MNERRYFIPAQVTGGWQLYGLSPKHLLRLLPIPPLVGLGVAITLLLWGFAPSGGLLRLVIRSLYAMIPLLIAVAWVGLMIVPIAEAGRTWWDVKRLARSHQRQQTVFLPRRATPPPSK